MASLGLDIGSYAIKILVGKKSGPGLAVERALEVPNPIGSVLAGDAQQRQKLIDALANTFKEQKLPMSNIRVSLAESMVVTKVVTMPILSEAELASAIQWQVEQHIPIPLEQMDYEYSVLRRSQPKDPIQDMDVLLLGAQKQYVSDLADLLLDAGLDVTAMETDTLAQLRVLALLMPPNENAALLHLGASASSITLLLHGNINFSQAVPTGGVLFSRAIERGVGLDAARAEEYKRTYGLQAQQLEGRVRAALVPIIDSLTAEVQKALRFFSAQHPGENITRVYVSGGSIYLPELLPYLSQALSVELVPVEMGRLEGFTFKEPIAQDSRFVVAAGLLLKED
jgi:type IV pilus assembly protein PilM